MKSFPQTYFYNLPAISFLYHYLKFGISKPVISTGPQIRIDRPYDEKFKH